MKTRFVLLVIAMLASLPALLNTAPVRAQDGARAGVIVVHGDGSMTQQCVPFAEESISGYELLKRAGLALGVEASSTGASICSIDGEGCNFPQESCFCQCQSSPCVYWSYWRLQEGGWLYQNLGAGNTQVRDGDVEGWHWSEGTVKDAQEPPSVTFDQICGVPQPATTATAATAIAPEITAAPQENGPATAAPNELVTRDGLWLLAGAAGVVLAGGIWYMVRARREKAP
jgi:hypothetical protein